MVLGLPVMQLPGDWRPSPTHSSTWGHPLDRDLVGQVHRYDITCKMGAPAPQELYTVHLYGLAALGPSFGGFHGPQLTAHGLAPAPIYCVTLGWLLYFSELWTPSNLYSQYKSVSSSCCLLILWRPTPTFFSEQMSPGPCVISKAAWASQGTGPAEGKNWLYWSEGQGSQSEA